MDELTEKISALLNSPDGMKKIQSTLSALGMGGGESENAAADRAAPALPPEAAALLSPGSGSSEGKGGGGGFPDLQMVAKFAPLLSGFKNEDENTRLLNSLRPFLSGDREKRLDEAIRMLRMLKVMPLLKDQHLF